MRSIAAIDTPISFITNSPDTHEKMKQNDEEEEIWDFAYDNYSDSMESLDSDNQMNVQKRTPQPPFTMYSETVASEQLLVPPQRN